MDVPNLDPELERSLIGVQIARLLPDLQPVLVEGKAPGTQLSLDLDLAS